MSDVIAGWLAYCSWVFINFKLCKLTVTDAHTDIQTELAVAGIYWYNEIHNVDEQEFTFHMVHFINHFK